MLKIFRHLKENDEQAFIPLLVFLELNWVLKSRYDVERQSIIENFLMLLSTEFIKAENHNELKQMLIEARDNNYDLSDLLIAMRCQLENAIPVMTFDNKASNHMAFEKIILTNFNSKLMFNVKQTSIQ